MSLQRLFARGSPLEEKDSSEEYKKEDFTIKFSRRLAQPIIPKIEPIGFITPNRLTWFGFFWVILGAGILSTAGDNILLLFSVGLCYWIAHYFDIVDGMLARARNTSSDNGKWLDSVLEEGKGYFFFIGLGLNIQDPTGHFVLDFLGINFGPLNVWMILFIMYGVERWIALMALWGNYVLDEPRVVSSGNIYLIWIILIFNLLELFLVLYTIGAILTAIWTLFEKTFLYSPIQTPQSK